MIAKEGFPYILITIAGLLALIIIPKSVIVVLGFLLLLLFFWFFRDPERRIPSLENVAVSGADGKVVEVGVVDIDGKKYQKVSVFMNLFSVHVNRAPIRGIVKSITHVQGEFMNAAKPEASIENERNIMVLGTEHGDVIVTQVAGLVARRTVCNVSVGESLDTGDRYGMIKFSSRVDHYFPMSFNITVNEDDQVKAGESIIATF